VGFLKGIRDVKRMSDHHGGMPSIRGSFSDLGKLADDRGEHEVIERGVPATAIAKGFAEPVPGDRFAMHILLSVRPPSGAPYDVDYVFPTTRMKAAITVGMEIPVKIHPEDPQRIAVQWNAQLGSIAAAGGDMAAVMGGLNATYATVADTAMRQAQATEDPTTRLTKLQQMRDAGLVTADEFEAKKADILGAL
jgi:hypothetical protein